MQRLAFIFRQAAFLITATVVLVGPWLFGAWEMWCFWGFAIALSVATLCLGLSWTLGGGKPLPLARGNGWLFAAFVPFLLYAYLRFRQAGVYIDAERAFLLHLTAWLVALIALAGAGPAARRTLFVLCVADLFALGAYGLANHLIDGSRHVLWVPGGAAYIYDERATGSYFCPDHFAGIMELAICLGLAMFIRCGAGSLRTTGALLVALATVGVVLSKSRGAGLTLLVIAGATLVWGFAHLPSSVRLWLRLSTLVALVAGLVIIVNVADGYVARFERYVGFAQAREIPLREAIPFVVDVLREQDRPLMFAGAVRAWRSHPWLGIGPGMHMHVWPHYGPSPDGDRAARRWPTRPMNTHVVNAVHNDWLQLLEEFGIIGFALFVIPGALVVVALRRRVVAANYNDTRAWRRPDAGIDAAMPLAALLCTAAMAFHSLGDFNLQMPATTWLLAALVALPFGTGAASQQGPAA